MLHLQISSRQLEPSEIPLDRTHIGRYEDDDGDDGDSGDGGDGGDDGDNHGNDNHDNDDDDDDYKEDNNVTWM